MKLYLIAILVAAAVAMPIPDEDNGNIDIIVNGLPEGEPLDIGHIIDIKAHETVNGEVVAATNVLHPFTAVGLAEAAAVAEAEAIAAEGTVQPEIPVNPAPVAPEVTDNLPVPELVSPEDIPNPVVLPEPAAPVVVVPVEPESPATPVEVIEVPAAPLEPESPATPVEVVEVPSIPEVEVPEAVPQPALQTGEVFNNGLVSMVVNANQPTLLSTLQNWLSVVYSYVSNVGAVPQTTQIV